MKSRIAQKLSKRCRRVIWATSEEDMLEHYTLQFAKALKENGMRFQLKDFRKDKKLTHAFSVFDPYLKESRETMNQMVHFFEKT